MCDQCATRFALAISAATIASLPTLPVEIKTRADADHARLYDFARALRVLVPSPSKAQADANAEHVVDFLCGLGPARIAALMASCHYLGSRMDAVHAAARSTLIALAENDDPGAVRILRQMIEHDNQYDRN